MAILSDRKYPFGGRVSTIQTSAFSVVVSTAKEGMFKPLSTMVIDHTDGLNRPFGKLIYTPSARKTEIHFCHKFVVEALNEMGEDYLPIGESFQNVIDALKERGMISEAINLAL